MLLVQSMDRKLEKLILKAEGKKRWHCFLHKRIKSSKLKKTKSTPQNAERYKVFIKTTYSENWQIGIFWFYIFGSGLVLLFIIFAEKSFANEKVWASYFFLLLPVYIICNSMLYLHFKGWRKRLPFNLIGWDILVNTKKFDEIFWRDNCKITINNVNPDTVETKAIKAALIIFSNKSKKEIYSADTKDAIIASRRKKFIVNNLTAKGSANAAIIRHLRKLCQNELTMISKRFNNIDSVIISIDNDTYTVMENLPDGGAP